MRSFSPKGDLLRAQACLVICGNEVGRVGCRGFWQVQGKGKTLPQIVFEDPDWFFWALEKGAFKGDLATQAQEVGRKAQNIKIPGNEKGELVAEYLIQAPTGKFSDLEVVPRSRPPHEGGSPAFSKNRIDLGFVRQIKSYDKMGGKLLVGCVKHIVFGGTRVRLDPPAVRTVL